MIRKLTLGSLWIPWEGDSSIMNYTCMNKAKYSSPILDAGVDGNWSCELSNE